MVVNCNTFLFADLCDYTERSYRHGDEFAAELAVGFHVLVRELAASESCEVVKAIGDAVMVRSNQAHDALRLGSQVIALGSGDCLRVRAGIDVGPAVQRAGDWYGSTVNTAARVADAALPGELIVTDRARAALAGASNVRLMEHGVRALKGLPSTLVHMAAA